MRTFESYHPAVLMIYFLSVLLIAMFVPNPVLQLCALSGGILFSLMIDRSNRDLKAVGVYAAMFLAVAITNPLFSHSGVTTLFFLNGNPVTLEAFAYGISIAVMLVGVLLWCRCYSKVMTSDKFLYLTGNVAPKLSLVLSIALRFVPMFTRQMRRVSRAQTAMGFYSAGGFVDRIRNAMRVFMAMIAWSLENAMETASSMKARGYGIKGRSNFSLFRFNARDGAMLFLCVLLVGITMAGTASGEMIFRYYPRIGMLSRSPIAAASYAAFGALSFLPLIIEVRERIVWKYCVSRI